MRITQAMIRRAVYALRESGYLYAESASDFLVARRVLESAFDSKAKQAKEEDTAYTVPIGVGRIYW